MMVGTAVAAVRVVVGVDGGVFTMVKVQVFPLLDGSGSVRRGSVSQLVMLGVQMFKSKYYDRLYYF
jgi:hypothetical protein